MLYVCIKSTLPNYIYLFVYHQVIHEKHIMPTFYSIDTIGSIEYLKISFLIKHSSRKYYILENLVKFRFCYSWLMHIDKKYRKGEIQFKSTKLDFVETYFPGMYNIVIVLSCLCRIYFGISLKLYIGKDFTWAK